jgi:hypothetical protein
LLLGAAALGGTLYGVAKHAEAKRHEEAARDATVQAEHAARQRRQAEERVRKLAVEIANAANTGIARSHHVDAPPLKFEGCFAAATDGVHICIDMNWLLTGIVDPAEESGSIWGRLVGALAHEWYHFLDTARGTRPSHVEELKADAFAGKQLARLKFPPGPFASLLESFQQSKTHPHGHLRATTFLEAHAKEKEKLKV